MTGPIEWNDEFEPLDSTPPASVELDPRELIGIRNMALTQAVAVAAAPDATRTVFVLHVAQRFERYLLTGEVPDS